MSLVGPKEERFVEEDLLGLPERYAVTGPVLLDVSFVPVEAGTAVEEIERCHRRSIRLTYTPKLPTGA